MKKIYIGLLGLCMLLGLNSCVKVNAGTVPAPSNGYSIQRVYFDPILNFRIYKEFNMNNKDKVTVVRPGETVKFGKATVTNKTKQTKYY